MSIGRPRVVVLVIACAACHHQSALETVSPAGPSLVLATSGNCIADVSEITGPDTTFPEALLKDGAACPTSLYYAVERHCVGVYVAISRGHLLLGGSTLYYDGDRRLFAAESHSDYPAYCGGTSFNVIYGTLPQCPAASIVTDLCRR